MTAKYAFLHIRKTAGSAFREVLQQHNRLSSENRIRYLSHAQTLQKIAEADTTANLIFIVRDPVSRFVSGFNSRLRKGKRGDKSWRMREERAFSHFSTPNQLAEALSSWNPWRRMMAKEAMKGIPHLKKHLTDYVGPIPLLEREKHRIFFIASQTHLNDDFEVLRKILGIDEAIALPTDPQVAHRAPDTVERTLSAKGEANIRHHYRKDFEVYEWCMQRRSELLALYKSK
ncbi:sulfotransferase family 2 domain-containing protein [Rhizobium sp. KVB221]|uniref:Sulfotransferase family 2 domain-containing protein n=1 Tax=Rhizobium setariae TaxID=2801340 RepID=A0A936YJ54_9HYPH|nr:sulfotransferase family 2 domain-containing protein [Rhizobium setariae]MBL0371215.1 sulfotransferase family 2 domain-containing protein [Rhizobium setariae]